MALTGIWKKKAAADAKRVTAEREVEEAKREGEREAEEAKREGDRLAREKLEAKRARARIKSDHDITMFEMTCKATAKTADEAKYLDDALWDWLQQCMTCGTDHTEEATICSARRCQHVFTRSLKPGYETHGATYTCRACGHVERSKDPEKYQYFLRDFVDEIGVLFCISVVGWRIVGEVYIPHRESGLPAELFVSPDTYDRMARRLYGDTGTPRAFTDKKAQKHAAREIRKAELEETTTDYCASCKHDKLQHQKKGCAHPGCGCSKFRRGKR